MKKNTTEQRVYYADTDHGGVVYYANYLRWFEIGRTELLRDLGVDRSELESGDILLPVVEVKCEYKASAKYNDVVRIVTGIEKVGNKSIIFGYEVLREEQLLAKGHTVNVFVKEEKSVEIPESIRKKFTAHER
jgi:acyl-CoA thioester hydrolase